MNTTSVISFVLLLVFICCHANDIDQKSSLEAPPGSIDEKLRSGSAAPISADPTRISPEAALYDTTKTDLFISSALLSAIVNVELARLAQTNSEDEQVKMFGQNLEQDHGSLQRQLLTIGREEEFAISRAIEGDAARLIEQLRQLKGKTFDTMFLSMVSTGHAKDLSDYRLASASNPNAKLKQFASDAIPVIEKNLAKAQELAQRRNN